MSRGEQRPQEEENEPVVRSEAEPPPASPASEERSDPELDPELVDCQEQVARLQRQVGWKDRSLLTFLKENPLEPDLACLQRLASSTDPKEQGLLFGVMVAGLHDSSVQAERVRDALADNRFDGRDITAIQYLRESGGDLDVGDLTQAYDSSRFPYGLGAALASLELGDAALFDDWSRQVEHALVGTDADRWARKLVGMMRQYPVEEFSGLFETLRRVSSDVVKEELDRLEQTIDANRGHATQPAGR